jgi:hypothetical protein
MTKRDAELNIGTGLMAAVNVAVANTVHVLTRPFDTAKIIVGLEKDKTIPEMIGEEETRLAAKRDRAELSKLHSE